MLFYSCFFFPGPDYKRSVFHRSGFTLLEPCLRASPVAAREQITFPAPRVKKWLQHFCLQNLKSLLNLKNLKKLLAAFRCTFLHWQSLKVTNSMSRFFSHCFAIIYFIQDGMISGIKQDV